MKETILQRLAAIEQEYHIRILFACESGSRGWGFPSPDSDYDVRFLYVRPYDDYLSITEQEDSLDFAIDATLDINGWDIRKALQLIRKSNTTPFEWIQSPVIYKEQRGFRQEFWTLCQQYYSQRSNSYHYQGITRGALDTLNEKGEIGIKKLFYVLRPLLSALWSLERKTIAPMNIEPLMALLPGNLYPEVAGLITKKASAPESFMIRPGTGLMNWINKTLQECLDRTAGLPKDHFEAAALDHFFKKIINQQ